MEKERPQDLTVKQCRVCGHWKNARDFYRIGKRKKYLNYCCKECSKKRQKDYQKKTRRSLKRYHATKPADTKEYAKKRDHLKLCYMCSTWKRHDEFYKDRSHSTGLSSRCKKCDNQRREDRRETRRQSIRSRP